MSDPICAKCKYLKRFLNNPYESGICLDEKQYTLWKCMAEEIPNFITGVPDLRNCFDKNRFGTCEHYEAINE